MELSFRKGRICDTGLYVQFLETVRAAMPNKEWFYLDPPELIREMMEDGTMELWVAMDGTRMAAAFHILHPGLASYNYGYDLEFSEEDLQLVVHMDSSAVHPDHEAGNLIVFFHIITQSKVSSVLGNNSNNGQPCSQTQIGVGKSPAAFTAGPS